ncbi:tetratricopeptide repeat protein [Pasteurellaceae bacterium USgator11]|nr:tetratricopeptide repeat protein [Pasteurellaceae bacterium USgator41]TNG94345.1 tetratricopeptide repeat protein [Pasteurellaceae bacterium UScroc12]TNH00204.1 tetratricopeptide repeat protein [Pasteurellaceae bacterium USgator11]TNH01247.1 tetratricopeptide repeat protein [Pasteurellaceae bacterium UScroc31]
MIILDEEERTLQKALMVRMVELYKVVNENPKSSSIWGRLGHMVRKVHLMIDKTQDPKMQIHQLLQLVYGEWGFHCNPNNHFAADAMLIDQLLDKQSGTASSLSALVLYLAESLNLPVFPVNFPTQVLLRADVNNETAFINPWDGEYLFHDTLDKWIEGYVGFGLYPDNEDLAVADPEILQEHFVQNLKNALIREGRGSEALRLIEWCLRRQPNNPYEIRDRGLVLASMDCYHAALADFDYFIEQCPDDPTSDLLRDQLLGGMVQEYSIH